MLQKLDAQTATADEALNSLARDGGIVLCNLIPPEILSQISTDLIPHLSSFWESDSLFSTKSRVVSSIAAKSPSFISNIACNPLFLEICDHLLTSTYTCWYGTESQETFTSKPQLNAAIAISNHPGNEPQKLHRDDMGLHHRIPAISAEEYQPGRDAAVGIFVAATQTHQKNGATRFIPGSHLWDTARRPDEGMAVHVELEPGDAFVMLASCFHGGSANRSDRERTIYSAFYTKGYLRQVCSFETFPGR